MNQSAVGWIALAIAVIVYIDLLVVELRRIAREGERLVQRVSAYADLPVIAQAARVETDIDRITASVDAIALLIERARAAIATIRHPRGTRYDPLLPNGSDASNGFSADG